MAAVTAVTVAPVVATTKASSSFKGASSTAKANAMQVWSPLNNYKYETLSYLPDLNNQEIAAQVNYCTRMGWTPCIEFEAEPEKGFVYRQYGSQAGYYDGRYWTMWKLPLFGCSDAGQVLEEVAACKREYPSAYIRVIGFDPVRQVQCISFIVNKPGGMGYSAPPQQSYAPPPQQSYSPPPQQGYGAPPPQQGYGASPPQQSQPNYSW
jgi:ribulose-bisphosphate carboxylase small chain